MLFKIRERELNKIFVHKIFETCTCRKKILACAWSSCIHSVFYSVALIDFYQCHCKGVFTWRWGTPGRWSNPPSRGRKNKTCLQPRGAGVRFIEVDVALAVRKFEYERPKLTSRERWNINSWTHMYLSVAVSRDFCHETARNVQSFKTYVFSFWAFCHERDPG